VTTLRDSPQIEDKKLKTENMKKKIIILEF
jgi:hypothetical protein